MNPLQAALADLDRELFRLGVRWALIGGLAISVRAMPRSAARRMTERGAHRGKDLLAAIRSWKESDRGVTVPSTD